MAGKLVAGAWPCWTMSRGSVAWLIWRGGARLTAALPPRLLQQPAWRSTLKDVQQGLLALQSQQPLVVGGQTPKSVFAYLLLAAATSQHIST